MSKASVTSTDVDFQHRIRAGHFDLVTDEPVVLGGQGQGPAPFDLYLAALAACTAITIRMYAKRRAWDIGAFRAELILRRDETGAVRVQRILHSDRELSAEQWARLMEIADRSPVTRAMREGAEIVTSALPAPPSVSSP
ncbi:OsmC family protein [Stenotrophomonas sp. Marseille-Q4652]|uniref:OsmC family protein n=1 Tax=Stenotrophomonas sp. Marseille-Q4652 TaxID=2866595 RepID=UPI001CE44A1E|nr:OsmC family protein [Stenotrophomonas sp. Marseille-Q4652]